MSPSAEPANLAAQAPPVAARLLEDGEIVILAVKPSWWLFSVLTTMVVLERLL